MRHPSSAELDIDEAQPPSPQKWDVLQEGRIVAPVVNGHRSGADDLRRLRSVRVCQSPDLLRLHRRPDGGSTRKES